MSETVLVIPDTHYPFAHRDHLDFLCEVRDTYHPTKIVHIGDELDYHAISEHDHDPDGWSPGQEFRRGLRELKKLYAEFPEASVCVSNHGARPYRRAYKYGIPRRFLKEYKQLLEAPDGWNWGDKWEIDGVLYEHGEGVSGKFGHLKAAEQNMQSTVIGHIHAHAGIAYAANPRYLIFGFNVGWLGNKDTYAMAYGKNFRSKPIVGCGIIRAGIPLYVPMQLRKGGRWTGKV